VNGISKQSNRILEYMVLAIVIFASTSIGIVPENEEDILETEQIFGTVTLSTRTAMNSLGLDENTNLGAIATIDLVVTSVISEGCKTCENIPSGLQIEGFVEIKNIRNQMGGLGRIEGTLSITYLKENIDNDFISKEWFEIDWNASGGTESDTFTQFTIIHDPPKWELENRYDAGFVITDESKESRTGPWLLAKSLLDKSINVQGCFPDSFSCEKSLNPDINLTSVKKVVTSSTSPIIITHPNELIQINDLESSIKLPSLTNNLRELFEIKNETNNHNIWCNEYEGDILAVKSWDVGVSNNNIIAPMSLWLGILNLPSSTFIQTSGTWSEIDFDNSGCASLSDNKQNMRLGIIIK